MGLTIFIVCLCFLIFHLFDLVFTTKIRLSEEYVTYRNRHKALAIVFNAFALIVCIISIIGLLILLIKGISNIPFLITLLVLFAVLDILDSIYLISFLKYKKRIKQQNNIIEEIK